MWAQFIPESLRRRAASAPSRYRTGRRGGPCANLGSATSSIGALSVIASLRFLAVALGVGIGSLAATVLALVFWGVLTLVGFEDAPLAGLAAAVIVGFGVSGYSAGRLAPHTHRFHGAVAGLGLAGLVLIMARLGGSPAPLGQVLLLFLLGTVIGGASGIAGGRRR